MAWGKGSVAEAPERSLGLQGENHACAGKNRMDVST